MKAEASTFVAAGQIVNHDGVAIGSLKLSYS